MSTLALGAARFRCAEAGRFATVFFFAADFLVGLAREAVDAAFFAVLAGVAAAFLVVRFLALAVEADFFFVTFFRASFRLDVDLPALAVFLVLVFFFAAFFATFFLVAFRVVVFFPEAVFFDVVFFEAVFFEVDFFLTVDFFFEAGFLLAARLPARDAVDDRDVFFAVFLLVRFLAAAFLVGIQGFPEWLQMQPAIIHRSWGCGSLIGPVRAEWILRAI